MSADEPSVIIYRIALVDRQLAACPVLCISLQVLERHVQIHFDTAVVDEFDHQVEVVARHERAGVCKAALVRAIDLITTIVRLQDVPQLLEVVARHVDVLKRRLDQELAWI